MQNQQWYQIAEARQVEVYPLIRKPDLASSNSYILRTAEQMLVIDPGGSPEQTQSLVDVLRARLQERPMPVVLYLTHCHVDHAIEAIRSRVWQEFPGLKIVIHEAGAKALSTGDTTLTQAGILGVEFPSVLPDASRFLTLGKETRSDGGAAFVPEVVLLGADDHLEVFATPGHSPDGVCYRVGEVLFVGDLLAAVSPLVAGVAGWSHPELIASLQGILRFLESHRTRFCCPGHGNILSGETILKAFQKTLTEAATLARIEPVNVDRVRFVTLYAQELFEELGALFGLIHSRIERVAQRLHEFEEYSAARQIRQILDSDQVTQLLSEFSHFQSGLRAGQIIEVQVALKAIQVVPRIRRLMEYEKLKRVIDPSLLRLTLTLLTDFVQAAKGLRLVEEPQATHLNTLAAGLMAEIAPPAASVSLEDIPDDPAGFCEFLISSIAHVPVFKGIALRYDGSNDDVPVRVVQPRFHDTLQRFLEDLADWGASTITLTVLREPSSLVINAEFKQQVHEVSEHRLHPYRRWFQLSGSQMDIQCSPTILNLKLGFD